MDRRTVRTRAALRAAILELAAQQDVSELSVVEVARRAGINRVTFYDHATSPAALLVAVLADELDQIRAALLEPDVAGGGEPAATPDPLELVDRVARAVAAHVERHATIYERALVHERDAGPRTDPHGDETVVAATLGAPLSTLLADHFTRTLETFLTRHPWLRPPESLRPTTPGVAPGGTSQPGPGRAATEVDVPADAGDVVGPAEAREVRAYARYVALGSVGALETWLASPAPRDPDFFPRVARAALPAWWTTSPQDASTP
ncbi:TetR/AcrR family transcriptional regulator [Luteimicrobium sp. NPDC057192]|uniref:TetR/AcrR family transcriptional regulator n=1 Tax=Luteimicrobium sp. NPDC057192 TaxID=3346042 RepID=UPI00362ED5ED